MSQTEPPPIAHSIPYVDHHTGAKRVLLMHLRPPGATSKIPPVVSIDGRQYVVFWGTVAFEVPADRPVHVSVHLIANTMTQAGTALLLPPHKPELTYNTNYMSGQASLS